MEYVEGETLTQAVDARLTSPAQPVVHRQSRITARFIKPSNLTPSLRISRSSIGAMSAPVVYRRGGLGKTGHDAAVCFHATTSKIRT